jgi:hypothetical protein
VNSGLADFDIAYSPSTLLTNPSSTSLEDHVYVG